MTSKDFYSFCEENVKGVRSLWCGKEEIAAAEEKLAERYKNAKTIVGTLKFHEFRPIKDSTQVAVKCVSSDTQEFLKDTC